MLKIAGKWFGINAKTGVNINGAKPLISFYDLKAKLNNNKEIDFASFKGKKVMIVNTASDCGYTNQYKELQTLWKQYGSQLIVIAFPSNDFKNQEKRNDKEIESFCTLNYGVDFTLAAKSEVVKTNNQSPVFSWLTNKEKNGWNNTPPSWNFTKYLVNENGVLTHIFEAGISPTSSEVLHALNVQ